MGLDTTHDCWHGPYTSFTRFRNALAVAAGYTMETRSDRYGSYLVPGGVPDSLFTDGHAAGEWSEAPDDPLVLLICHSDCSGVIYPRHATLLADRIEGLLSAIDESDDHTRQKAIRFMNGLRDAAASNELVEFG